MSIINMVLVMNLYLEKKFDCSFIYIYILSGLEEILLSGVKKLQNLTTEKL